MVSVWQTWSSKHHDRRPSRSNGSLLSSHCRGQYGDSQSHAQQLRDTLGPPVTREVCYPDYFKFLCIERRKRGWCFFPEGTNQGTGPGKYELLWATLLALLTKIRRAKVDFFHWCTPEDAQLRSPQAVVCLHIFDSFHCPSARCPSAAFAVYLTVCAGLPDGIQLRHSIPEGCS